MFCSEAFSRNLCSMAQAMGTMWSESPLQVNFNSGCSSKLTKKNAESKTRSTIPTLNLSWLAGQTTASSSL